MDYKKLRFFKVYPMGNLTFLIDNSTNTIPTNQYKHIAQQLLAKTSFYCEQVGFFNKKKDHLELSMMGGELCINAIRSLGYVDYFLSENKNPKVMTKGYSNVYEMRINDEETETNFEMKILRISISKTLSIVELNGIAYFVEEFPYSCISMETASSRFNHLLKEHEAEISRFKAVGYIPFHKEEKTKNYTIKPIVYVRETESMLFETACGSGTIAAVIHEFYNKGNNDSPYLVTQPSGNNFKVNINPLEDNRFAVQLFSNVKIISEGYIYANKDYQII